MKNPQFEPYELRMIVNSIQAAQFITQQEADRLTEKIMRKLADRYTRPSLKRKTYIPNRVHAVNEEAMKGLDTIYEAIEKDRKISCKYFEYTLDGHNKAKKYHRLDNSKIITSSPYTVVWENDNFWLYAILKVPKHISFIATVYEEATPELFMWTRQFTFPIEIIYPENAEKDLKEYFLGLAKDDVTGGITYGDIRGNFPYDNIR